MSNGVMWKRCRVVRCIGKHDCTRSCVCHLVGKEVVIIGHSKHNTSTYRALGRRQYFKGQELQIIAPFWHRYAFIAFGIAALVFYVWSTANAKFDAINSALRFIFWAYVLVLLGVAVLTMWRRLSAKK